MATGTMSRADQGLEKASAELMALQPKISNEMKMVVALELKCTTRTIETYLTGKGKKLPFALELLKKLKVVAA